MPTILLFRHGETYWNRAKRIQGHTDSVSPLTLKGIRQAQVYGRTLHRLVGGGGWRVVSSPLARCVQTSAVLCETAGLEFLDVTFDDRLKEVDTGDYSGWLKADLERLHPDLMHGRGLSSWYFRCAGGENWDQMAARIGAWLDECRPDDKVVVVTHGVAGKVLRSLYGGLDPVETLAEDSPQDALFRLHQGRVERLECDKDSDR
jgi:broad specificity phosphatase PhoE